MLFLYLRVKVHISGMFSLFYFARAGMVLAARLTSDRKLQHEKDLRMRLEEQTTEQRNTIEKLEARNSALELAIVQSGIKIEDSKRVCQAEITVEL